MAEVVPMTDGDRKNAVARRSKLWTVLVASGMALAAACAGMQKDPGSSGSGGSSGTSGTSGGGASGW